MNQAFTRVWENEVLESNGFLHLCCTQLKWNLNLYEVFFLSTQRTDNEANAVSCTFRSPARGPETKPSSITSIQTSGCWRLAACFWAWALANLRISLASSGDSSLSVLLRVRTHGLLDSEISKAQRRAVFSKSLGETTTSTRPSWWASSALIGLDSWWKWVYFIVSKQVEKCATGNSIKKNYGIGWKGRNKWTYQHHFKCFCQSNKAWKSLRS